MAGRSSRPAVGDVVTYRHEDKLTGRLLTGAAVVYESAESGGLVLAPLSDVLLVVDPADVQPVAGEQIAPAVVEQTQQAGGE